MDEGGRPPGHPNCRGSRSLNMCHNYLLWIMSKKVWNLHDDDLKKIEERSNEAVLRGDVMYFSLDEAIEKTIERSKGTNKIIYLDRSLPDSKIFYSHSHGVPMQGRELIAKFHRGKLIENLLEK